MTADGQKVTLRSLEDLDLEGIVRLDETISERYRPEIWERRVGYYLRRDPDCSVVALEGQELVGFMLGEVRSGEFGLEEPTGWIEVLAVDPRARGRAVGRQLAAEMLDRFRARGAITVRTLVDGDMPEIASFFKAIGFQPSQLQSFSLKL